MNDKNYIKGVILIIASAFCFALMAAFVHLSGDIPFTQKAFFRNAISFFIAGGTIINKAKTEGTSSIKIPKGSLKYLVLRSIAGTIGIFGNFYAIDHLILSDAGILNKMAPFWTLIFCFFLLGETIELIPLIAIIIAFSGALLIIKPGFNFSSTIPALAGFLSGLGAGFAYACVRKLGTYKCPSALVILFFSAFSMLTSVPFLILDFRAMTASQTIFLLLAGLSAAGGQFTITAAYYNAPASKISIFDFSQIIFSASLGFILFSQVPDIFSIIGYIIIISMATFNFIYNLKRN